jgi:hypothetical protein
MNTHTYTFYLHLLLIYIHTYIHAYSEVVDSSGVEWEEYCDKKVTSEYFYWDEEANLFQWNKPEVSAKSEAAAVTQHYIHTYIQNMHTFHIYIHTCIHTYR